MTIREITESICGHDNDFDPKAIINMSVYLTDENTELMNLDKELHMYKPVVKIGYSPELTCLDFIYPTDTDEDLKQAVEVLERYDDLMHEYTLQEDENTYKHEIPVCYIALYPVSNTGCFIYAANPMFWSLSALPDGRGCRLLKMCFSMENIRIMEGESIDTEDIIFGAEWEAEEKQYFAEQENQ